MAEEENVFVGTNCQSFDPSKVQCDKEGNMPIHILDKYCEENDTRYNICLLYTSPSPRDS